MSREFLHSGLRNRALSDVIESELRREIESSLTSAQISLAGLRGVDLHSASRSVAARIEAFSPFSDGKTPKEIAHDSIMAEAAEFEKWLVNTYGENYDEVITKLRQQQRDEQAAKKKLESRK